MIVIKLRMADEEKKSSRLTTGKRKSSDGEHEDKDVSSSVDTLRSKAAKRSRTSTTESRHSGGEDATSRRDSSEMINDFQQRYTPPLRLNIADQSHQRSHHLLSETIGPNIAYQRSSNLSVQLPTDVARASPSAGTNASSEVYSNRFLREMIGLRSTVSEEVARQHTYGSLPLRGFHYHRQGFDRPIHPNLGGSASTSQIVCPPSQAASGPVLFTNDLNHLLAAHSIRQTANRLPSSASTNFPNSLSLALSSLNSGPLLSPADTLSTLHRNQLASPLERLGLTGGLNSLGSGLSQNNMGTTGTMLAAAARQYPTMNNSEGGTAYLDLLNPPFRRLSGQALHGTNNSRLAGINLPLLNEGTASSLARQSHTNNAESAAGRQSGHPDAANSVRARKARPFTIDSDRDELCLSKFQCLARKQIEIFTANKDDVQTGARGRNTPIVLGQVGIRCRHCSHLPHQERKRGAVYYPTKFDRVYQTAVNMASIHFCTHCTCIPDDIRQELLRLKDNQKSIVGGGKEYWANGIQMLGLVETEEGLKFAAGDETILDGSFKSDARARKGA